MRRGAIAAARHAVAVTSIMQRPPLTRAVPVNLGTGIPLDMLLGDPEVTAVSAGAVWTGGGYWTSEGTGYWTGPTLDMSRPWEIVIRGDSTSNAWPVVVWSGAYQTAWLYLSATQSGTRLFTPPSSSSLAIVSASGNRTQFGTMPSSGVPGVDVNGSGVTDAAASGGDVGSGAIVYVGATRLSDATITPAPAGLSVWDVTIYQRQLTPTERTNIYASGVQTNPLTIAADAYACWDFANAYDNAGTPTVPDLVLGDGTRDLIGSPTVSIIDDITTGATF